MTVYQWTFFQKLRHLWPLKWNKNRTLLIERKNIWLKRSSFSCIEHPCKIVYKKTDKWYNEWQRVTTSDNEWQRITKSDNEWPFRLIFFFFQVREESTIKHPKENSLRGPLKKAYWIKSRSKHSRRNIKSKKQEKTTVFESLFKKVAGLETRKSIKRRLQRRCFPMNIAKFLKTSFSIEQLWWLLLEFRHNFKIYETSMTQT